MTDLTAAAQRALSLMDLTTLNDDDTDAKVTALCHQAKSPAGQTAAICIYPRFIPLARKVCVSRVRRKCVSRLSPTSRTVMMTLRLHWLKPMLRLLTAQMMWMWCSRTAH